LKNTWGRRCHKILFASDRKNASFPTIDINVRNGRDYLSHKTYATFQYIYEHHMNDADWFMKADDDTFVVMENLRYLLSGHSPSEPIFFGYLFKAFVVGGFPSGGAGYVLSKEAMQRYGKRNKSDSQCLPKRHAPEDMEIGRCMHSLGVAEQNALPLPHAAGLSEGGLSCVDAQIQQVESLSGECSLLYP
jgi:glycoprotein-N-acetylgalactosamine 3-beta-galactosyltransferase